MLESSLTIAYCIHNMTHMSKRNSGPDGGARDGVLSRSELSRCQFGKNVSIDCRGRCGSSLRDVLGAAAGLFQSHADWHRKHPQLS